VKRAIIAGGAFVMLLVLLASAEKCGPSKRSAGPGAAGSAASNPAAPATEKAQPAAEVQPGFLYGRVTTVDGATYEGRLRWGRDQEAFWDDVFNGVKDQNPWASYVPAGRLPKESDPVKILGVTVAKREKPISLGRRFLARFGDIQRMEAESREVRVTLKSGTFFDLELFESSDFDDGLRVWDAKRGVVDLKSMQIRAIDLLPTAQPGADANRLHGTVRTRHGEFTGFIGWDRNKSVGSDELDGGGTRRRFDTIRSIARRSSGSPLVILLDGREIELSGDGRQGNRGIYVKDPRYGQVLVSWHVFERVDFSPGDPGNSGPAYGDFPPGRPLTGSVTTRAGNRLAGRLVYDLDESETTDALDAPSQGVDYSIPFSLIASIVPAGEEAGAQSARVTLQNGEELQLESTGDLGEMNAGLLIFAAGQKRPEYVPWAEVARVEIDGSPASR
jgi:hypothetical protein